MPRILVVDNEPDMLEVMCKWLTLRRYDVLCAFNGAEAVRLASVGKPDLILLDISMPGGGGIETCRVLRTTEQTRHVPVILITGADVTAGRIDAMMAGAHDFVTKPVVLDELHRRIHILLSGNGALAEPDAPLSVDGVQAVLAILSCDLAWLFAVSLDGQQLESVSAATRWNPATAPSLREQFTIPLDPQAGRLARSAMSRVAEFNLPALGLSDFPRAVNKTCQDLDLTYISLIPLHRGNFLLGVLLIGARGNQDIDSLEGRQQMAAAANQVTMALENYRLAQKLAEVSKRQAASAGENKRTFFVWDILESVQQSTSLDKVLQTLLNQTTTMLNATLATILLLNDRHRSQLTIRAAAGLNAERLQGTLIPKSGIAGAVIDQRMPVVANDARHDPHFMLGFEEQWGSQVSSILAAPLLIGGQAIGVLEVINSQNEKFCQADEQMIQGVAHLASLMIEHQRLRAALDEHPPIEEAAAEAWLEPMETAEVASADILPSRPRQPTLEGLLGSLQGNADEDVHTGGKKHLPSAADLMQLLKGHRKREQTVQSRPTLDMDVKTPISAAQRQAIGQVTDKVRADFLAGFETPQEAPSGQPRGSEPRRRPAHADDSASLYRSMASLEHVAQSALDAVRSLAERSGIDLVTYIDGYLPDIYIDKGRIRDVTETLLEGAIKASLPGKRVRLAITDITESLQVKISYQEAELPVEDYPSIQRVIEQHQGHFDIKAQPDKGTAFVFTLPKAEITGMGDFLPTF
jgi:DNA-binding response OmpR family regulator